MINNMKFGGITWWRNNYGSILQAYALQRQINSYDGISYEIINQFGKRIVSFDNLIYKIKDIGILRTVKISFWKFGFKGLRLRTKSIQKFIDEKLVVSKECYTEKTIKNTNNLYDGFICGSDQIWNPELVSLDSIYWLNFVEPGKKKIAYAPSIGVSYLNDEQIKKINKNLESFDAISCREEEGTKLINTIVENQCITVLDPTLMVNKALWDEICTEKKFTDPYIFVYLLRGNKKQRKLIETFAKNKGLKIVTLPFLESDYIVWYDRVFGDIKLWDCAPDEFISAIRYASYVFTDSYHCIIFSCLYHVNFFVIPKIGNHQMSRIINLLEMLHIDNRVVNSYNDILDIEKKIIDWKTVDCELELKRKKSQEYLKQSLLR